jgi:hypothetical protein
MNPVLGLDVSKGESQVQAFLDKGQPYRKSFSIKHTLDSLASLLEFLKDIEKLAEGKPFKVAIIACANKLLHWVYALLKNRTTFQNIV